jgi:uncharacterized protein YbjT (DUF2867 family)
MRGLAGLAVTGSTGALGGMVARQLAGRGRSQRLLARNPVRAPVLDGATAVPFAYGDAATTRKALESVRTVFMVSASESRDRLDLHRTFVDAAAESGIQHMVYTSFLGASSDCTFTLGRDHYATEEHIKATGMTYTFLRNNFYIEFLANLPGDDGVIRGPAGDGRVSAVSRGDIARAAVAVLEAPDEHRDTTYDLTGPEAISLADVARILSTARGRDIVFHHETIEEAYESRRTWQAPDWQYDAWVSTYTAIENGEVDRVSSDIATLTAREPLSLADYLVSRP